MHLIAAEEEELYQTLSLAGRMGKSQLVKKRLEQRYEEAWANPQASFPYALALTAELQDPRPRLEKHLVYGSAIEVLDDVIYAEDHWLARYLRARLRALIPRGYRDFTVYVDSERRKGQKELYELIDRQSKVQWQPYFASTYLLAAARACTETAEREAGRLIAEAKAHPARPVPFHALGSLLCEPFLTVLEQVSGMQRQAVARLMSELFPDQQAVGLALAKSRAR